MTAKRNWYPFEKLMKKVDIAKDKIIIDGLACGRNREKKKEESE